MFGARSAGRADVEFRADIGQFRGDVTQARRIYEQSTGAMSDAALRQVVAQEKLDRAIHRYGAESLQAKRETLAFRNEMRNLQTQTDRTDRELEQTRRTLDRVDRQAHSSARGIGRLRASVGGMVLGLTGGATGLVYALKQAMSASSNHAEQQDFAIRIFERAFPVVRKFAAEALGFARDQAYEATAGIGALLRPLGILPGKAAELSVQLSKLGADFASMRNAKVEDVLLAIRAGLVGESEPLRRFSVLLSEARVQQVALAQTGKDHVEQLTNQDKVMARVAIIFKDGQLALGNYRDTLHSVANQEREAQTNWRDTQILIGDTLRPSYRGLLQDVNEYLGNQRNQRRIQREVNEAVEQGEKVVRGLARGIRFVGNVIEPVVDALGGLENAAQLAFIVGVAKKAGISAVAIRAIRAASAFATRGVVADSVVMSRALDGVAASAGRAAGATTLIGGAPGSAGTGRTGRRGIPPVLTGNPALVAAGAVLISGGGGTQRGDRSQRYPLTWGAVLRAAEGTATPEEVAIVREELRGFSLANAPDDRMARAERRLRQLRASTPVRPDDRAGPRGPGSIADSAMRPRRRRRRRQRERAGRFTLADVERESAGLEEQRLDAEFTPGTRDDVAALTDELALVTRALTELDLTREQRMHLKERKLAILNEIEGIKDEEQRKADELREKRREERERRRKRAAEERRRREAREEREMDAFERATRRRDLRRTRGFDPLSGFGGGLAGALVEGRDRSRTRRDPDAITRADFERITSQFVDEFARFQREYAPNFQPEWTQQLHEMRAQTHLLGTIAHGAASVDHVHAKRAAGARFDAI